MGATEELGESLWQEAFVQKDVNRENTLLRGANGHGLSSRLMIDEMSQASMLGFAPLSRFGKRLGFRSICSPLPRQGNACWDEQVLVPAISLAPVGVLLLVSYTEKAALPAEASVKPRMQTTGFLGSGE